MLSEKRFIISCSERQGHALLLLTAIVVLFTLLTASAAEKPQIIPAGAKITLELDRNEFFLGENILLHYCIENTGAPDFAVDVGGDYRGGTRANRFKITATNADGKPAADPVPIQRNMGGLCPMTSLTNGAKWFEHVWLARYCLFEEPGVYTVNVFHDLGWGEKKASDPREVTATIKLKRPTQEQARKVVEDMFAALKYVGPTWGKKSEPMADFSVLRDPIYLPILVERARAGSLEGLRGITSIPTPEATEALIQFLKPGADRPLAGPEPLRNHDAIYLPSSAEAKSLALAAAMCLQERLPQIQSDQPSSFAPDTPRKQQLRRMWRPECAETVRAFALRLLTESNRDAFLISARELNSLGRKEDLPALMAALDHAVAGTTNQFRADHHYPEPFSSCGELAGAYERISIGDSHFPPEPNTTGSALLYLRALKTNAIACPSGWETNCAMLLRHELPYLRAQTLSHMPRPIPESLTRLLSGLMLDPDITVQSRAFLIAEEVRVPEHRDIALKVLATATNQWLFHLASRVAIEHGANYECAEIWAKRFDETLGEPGPAMSHWAMLALWEIVTDGHINGGFNRTLDGESLRDLKQHWVAFIEAHRDDLKVGRHFTLGDGILTKDLLPDGWTYYPPKHP